MKKKMKLNFSYQTELLRTELNYFESSDWTHVVNEILQVWF